MRLGSFSENPSKKACTPMIRPILIALCSTLPQIAQAADPETPYAGFEARNIKSLSQSDIDELSRGGGWGMALPAELSGRPGPAHVLELSEELALTPVQITHFKAEFAAMQAEAIAAGEAFIAAEAALSDAFDDVSLDADTLAQLVQTSAQARAQLRLVHLQRHLASPEHLTQQQIHLYAKLRGYGSAGHDHMNHGNH